MKSIEDVAGQLVASLSLDWDGQAFQDPIQKVRVAFFHPRDGRPLIELVEPAGPESPVARFLERGGGLHHVCYEVESLEDQLEQSKKIGDLVVRAPAPAVAFSGRRIAWVYTKFKLLVEYLEHTTR